MLRKSLALACVGVCVTVLLVGCDQMRQETPIPEPEPAYVPVVSVTGELVPAAWAELSAQAGGLVVAVSVAPGDPVAAGDVLIQLDPTNAELAVQQAEAAVAVAQAELALLKVAPDPEEIAIARGQVEAADAALAQATAQRDQFRSGATTAEAAAARAQLAAAEAEQKVAWDRHDDTMQCFQITNPDGTKRKFCPALGSLEEEARLALHAADEAVAAAKARLNAVLAGAGDQLDALEAGVAAAEAQRAIAQARLDLIQADIPPERIAVAEAAVAQAQVALAASQLQLERCVVRAPFAGTAGVVAVRAGETIIAGQPLVTLGDLDTLRVETTDLDELDVARVAADQKAAVIFDALPERTFAGRVTRIAPMAKPGTGAVNFTVVIELDELDPALRWGMTAFVDIEVE
jgi:multidrug efflux pump subunit AcrA (membrane-fusion protein)